MLWSCIFDRSKLQGFVGEVDFLQQGPEIVWWAKSVCLVGQVNTGFTLVWITILEFSLFTLLLLFNSLWTNSITDNSHIINPLIPNSDQDQISPNNIHTLSRDKLWQLIKWSHERRCLDLLSNSLNSFFKEMYRDQFGEFVCGHWGLKG